MKQFARFPSCLQRGAGGVTGRNRLRKSMICAFICLGGLLAGGDVPAADTDAVADFGEVDRTIQFDVSAVLNTRVVTTSNPGGVTTWKSGIDGSWSGLATSAAANEMGNPQERELPDDGTFAANRFHPRIDLHFSNADAVNNQVRFTGKQVEDAFSFAVPERCYACLSLFFMSAFGTSEFKVEVTYQDQTTQTGQYSVEDWATGFPESIDKYFLAADLAKWGPKNNEMEKNGHYLAGINFFPDSAKPIVRVSIKKSSGPTTLLFWGATGYTTRPAKSRAATSNFISYEGRTLFTTNGTDIQGFPGIVTRVNFQGADLGMRTRTDSEELYLDVSIDHAVPRFTHVAKGDHEVMLVENAGAGPHHVDIWKRVESCVGILEIVSFSTTGTFLPAAPLPERRLLFLGDSFTAGQAAPVEDGIPMDPTKAMRENARLSYARILADRLNAQCHILAYAGRGVVRDWQGISAVRCAPDYYECTLPDDPATQWDFSSYVPDGIGVCLGNNDFDTGVPDEVHYVKACTEFFRKLRRDAPHAWIFLITSPILRDAPDHVPLHSIQTAYLREAAQELGDSRVRVIVIGQYPVVPGDWHPGGAAHRAVANELESDFRKALNWP